MFDFRAENVWPEEPRVARRVRAEYVQQVVRKRLAGHVIVVTESRCSEKGACWAGLLTVSGVWKDGHAEYVPKSA